MQDDVTTRDLTPAELALLAQVLDEIVPPAQDGGMPGAGALGIGGEVDATLRRTPALRAMVVEGLGELEAQARTSHPDGFAGLSHAPRAALLAQQGFLLPLTVQTYAAYYRHPRVVAALGLEPRPPHPQGYPMEPDDLSLLEAVRRRGRLYRAV